ncbi:MAG: outer membrane lipid asymmetry maintenance protein MlaD [Zymomonas mobilis subsp. pomaceae]|uniref:Mammalian cell entry related domain protein n=1 Tax=Zymomonas mobilis subsp. pomaceae (strain ATCC 29192 / DSM 22645 / JCM 10191 / CCUG 17912 / NBRC 13757 / NCIMB 11200 / NRRL B-4491 / Barker I) TaxID=579138 RepID=F8EUV7_ZYMMT|nr:outer membrane lipid asymmetry maintenance protein MlaD [Zymomonas mobilis]AEI37245.1 Mammalian cell entry related domain protein [Zymomonas mobilis subsp. pomaceae ATCC 29192]MDX5948614.1 outer membrane lipid asymmetry maintenance protein MlaD [Zymomonas mobilis subsp. pomaceae]GEB88420.1 outer membrane lipid asymmetry maintenance protein MlaD [Zymomonas mobilis subsp. pomaceae]
MKNIMREYGAEALVGLLVIIATIGFAIHAWKKTGGGVAANAIHIKALFPNAGGIDSDSDVKIAGVKVGSVVTEKLDPQSYQVMMTLALDPTIPVPSDSSAAITSDSLLGSSYISLMPGGSEKFLKEGDTILDTQGSVNLMGLIGHYLNSSGGTAKTPSNDSSHQTNDKAS